MELLMKRSATVILLFAAFLTVGGCKHQPSDADAIREAFASPLYGPASNLHGWSYINATYLFSALMFWRYSGCGIKALAFNSHNNADVGEAIVAVAEAVPVNEAFPSPGARCHGAGAPRATVSRASRFWHSITNEKARGVTAGHVGSDDWLGSFFFMTRASHTRA